MPSDVPMRNVTDPRMLRALTHPVRLALLEALDQEGPLTATQAGELVGESPANTSFHLRTLAKYGFVEEAPGGTGRQRPWRVRMEVTSVKAADLTPEGKVAARALVSLLRERLQEYLNRWEATRDSYPPQWREAAGETLVTVHLTADELEKFNEAVRSAIHPYLRREAPEDALPVAIATHTMPIRPPRTTTDAPTA